MRPACTLAIALCLSFPPAGTAWQQDPAGGVAPPAGQAPAASVSKPNAPPGATPATGKKAPTRVATKHSKRTEPAPAPDGAPRKIVVREGGANEPAAQIVPGMTPEEATRQRQNAEQLLGSTGEQLKQLADRTLNPPQLETVGQIRNYMDGARSALKEGDVRRASTLAEKAHLLAEDLAK